jgi:PTS system fructose-specific IIA component/PTS system nitrogen regulatory IIA component
MGKKQPSRTMNSCQFDLVLFASKFDFVAPEAVLPEAVAATKRDILSQLIDALAAIDAIPPGAEASVLKSVLQREELGTTGVGRGIAIPHVKHPAIREVVASVAYCPEGVDFDSLDGRKVQLVFLVLAPVDAMTEQLEAIREIAIEVRNGGAWEEGA